MSDQQPHAAPPEASIVETPAGRRPDGAGWFILNATQAAWKARPGWGRYCDFEPDDPRFRDMAINIHVLQPGEISTLYHAESVDEDFLVLAGECLALIEGEERPMRAWDFLHCPPWAHHGFVGAGDGPCAILMVGSRRWPEDDEQVEYVVDDAAARHGASADAFTTSPAQAYGDRGAPELVPYEKGTLPGA